MTTTTTDPPKTIRRRQGGPPPLVPAIAYGALMLTSVALAAGAPRITDTAQEALRYARQHDTRLQLVAFFAFGAAAPLAIWAAVIYRRLRTLGITAPGAVIGLVGGTLASASLAISGLLSWVLADTADSANPAVAHLLVDLEFATGGAGFVVPFALLVAGVAVPSAILRLLPRPLALGGVAIAAIGLLATLTLLTSTLDATLPIARFGGLIFLLAASMLLPANRHEVGRRREAGTAL